MNARGIKSKLTSLKTVITELEPDIIAIQETKLKEKENITIDNYKWIDGSRQKQEGGGVGFLISEGILKNIVREPKPESSAVETRWIRLILSGDHHICIGVYYGKQETHPVDKVQDEYNLLQDQINSYIMSGKHVLLVGDFNAKVGCGQEGIKDGDKNISRNGKMLLEMIGHSSMAIMNTTAVCQGKWTRVNSQNEQEKSILDYVLASPSISSAITDITIDENEDYKLFSAKTKTDHNTIVLNIDLN